jgi:hypothetical protein
MPRWLLTASMALSFGLTTIEFGRYLLGLDSIAHRALRDS